MAVNAFGGWTMPEGGWTINTESWQQKAARERAAKTGQTAQKTQLAKVESGREAKVAEREKEVRSIFDEIIAMYSPGGSYGQGTLAMLDRQKSKDMASATQSLVSAGLFNTTQAAGVGKKWEEEVGMPTRAKLEDVRYGALAGAKAQKAQAITNIDDQQIDYGLIAQLMTQGYGA